MAWSGIESYRERSYCNGTVFNPSNGAGNEDSGSDIASNERGDPVDGCGEGQLFC